MTSVFKHPWLSGVFGDPEVSAHLSIDTQLVCMMRIKGFYSGVLGNEAAALAVEAVQVTQQDLMLERSR